jgi:hypothetical protein
MTQTGRSSRLIARRWFQRVFHWSLELNPREPSELDRSKPCGALTLLASPGGR